MLEEIESGNVTIHPDQKENVKQFVSVSKKNAAKKKEKKIKEQIAKKRKMCEKI